MKKYDESLFKIGEVMKIMGLTRKALLVYEELGLLIPAVKDEQSGYRWTEIYKPCRCALPSGAI